GRAGGAGPVVGRVVPRPVRRGTHRRAAARRRTPRGRHTNVTPPAPWVIVSAGFHFAAGQAKAVAWLADYLARAGTPVHLVGNEFDAGLAARPGVTVHRVPRVRGADVVGNLFVARKGREVARRVTRENPAATVVVNSGNCLWADVNWVHYLHCAWSPDLS